MGGGPFPVIVNGKAGKSFRFSGVLVKRIPGRGFLFTLMLDVLGKIVDRAKEVGLVDESLRGMDGSGFCLSLQFADDTVLFPPFHRGA